MVSRNWSHRVAVVFFALGLLVALAAVNGSSATAATAGAVVCTGKAENPHYSKGSSGVIYKVRVVCTGPAVITLRTFLGSGPYIGPHVTRSYTTQPKAMVAGVQETFYTPQQPSRGIPCSPGVYYSGWGTLKIAGGTTDDFDTNRVTANCP